MNLTVDIGRPVWIGRLIEIAESRASCELYAVLKRPDEKCITEKAYENPEFVEDLVRDIVVHLAQEEGVRSCSVEAENFESIHNHSAYAIIRSPSI